MVLQVGNKLLISHRRLFAEDHQRFFLGTALAYEAGVVVVRGHTWIRDHIKGTFQKRADPRSKIMSLTSGSLIWYLLPNELKVEEADLELQGNKVWLIEPSISFMMELTEGAYPNVSGL